MAQTVSRICYFGVRDANYPRNQMISTYLSNHIGADIVKAEIETEDGFRKNFLSLARFVYQSKGRYDAVILSEFSLQFAILGYLLSRRAKAKFVVDFFVGLYETRVEDWGTSRKWSVRASMFHFTDLVAARLADLVVSDNDVRASLIQRKYKLSARPVVVHVGAPAWALYGESDHRSEGRDRPLRILYYGNYIPLHGVDTFVNAMIALRSQIDLTVTLIGDGEIRPVVEQIVRDSNCHEMFTFLPAVDQVELRDYISQHDIVAGVFGASPKAKNVIANKVWQGLACGAVVLTQKTPALDGIRESFPGLLWECESDIEAIGSSIMQIAGCAPVSDEARDSAAKQVKAIVWDGLEEMRSAIFREGRS